MLTKFRSLIGVLIACSMCAAATVSRGPFFTTSVGATGPSGPSGPSGPVGGYSGLVYNDGGGGSASVFLTDGGGPTACVCGSASIARSQAANQIICGLDGGTLYLVETVPAVSPPYTVLAYVCR